MSSNTPHNPDQMNSINKAMVDPCVFPILSDDLGIPKTRKLLELDLGKHCNLRRLCQERQIPVQRLIQTVWAIVLWQFTKNDTVLFGYSARNACGESNSPMQCLMAHMNPNITPLQLIWNEISSNELRFVSFNTGVCLQASINVYNHLVENKLNVGDEVGCPMKMIFQKPPLMRTELRYFAHSKHR